MLEGDELPLGLTPSRKLQVLGVTGTRGVFWPLARGENTEVGRQTSVGEGPG